MNSVCVYVVVYARISVQTQFLGWIDQQAENHVQKHQCTAKVIVYHHIKHN